MLTQRGPSTTEDITEAFPKGASKRERERERIGRGKEESTVSPCPISPQRYPYTLKWHSASRLVTAASPIYAQYMTRTSTLGNIYDCCCKRKQRENKASEKKKKESKYSKSTAEQAFSLSDSIIWKSYKINWTAFLKIARTTGIKIII